MNHHGQSLDPNLLALGEAWAVAAAKMGDAAARAAVPTEGEQEGHWRDAPGTEMRP